MQGNNNNNNNNNNAQIRQSRNCGVCGVAAFAFASERYVIMVFLAIDSDTVTDIKTSSFHQSRKPCPVSH